MEVPSVAVCRRTPSGIPEPPGAVLECRSNGRVFEINCPPGVAPPPHERRWGTRRAHGDRRADPRTAREQDLLLEDAEGHTRLTCPVVNKAHTVEVLPGAVCPGTPHGIPKPPGAVSELRSTANRKRKASAVRPGCQEGFLATRRRLGAPATRTVCPGAPKGRTPGHSARRLKSSLATGTRPADGRAYQ